MSGLARPSIDAFSIMGHRGARGHAPENTLASFEKGIELGATMLELDIHLTLDGQLAVIHDPFMERTTDGSGWVHEMTMAQIQALDAGSWFAPEFSGERIPTLQQVVDVAKGRAYLNIEVKTGGLKPNSIVYHDIIPRLTDVLLANDLKDQVVVSSFYIPYLVELKQRLPEVRVASVHQRAEADLISKATDAGFEAVHTTLSVADEAFVAQAHGQGVKVRVWTVNDAEDMQHALRLGIDGICTDYPDILVEQVRMLGTGEV